MSFIQMRKTLFAISQQILEICLLILYFLRVLSGDFLCFHQVNYCILNCLFNRLKWLIVIKFEGWRKISTWNMP